MKISNYSLFSTFHYNPLLDPNPLYWRSVTSQFDTIFEPVPSSCSYSRPSNSVRPAVYKQLYTVFDSLPLQLVTVMVFKL